MRRSGNVCFADVDKSNGTGIVRFESEAGMEGLTRTCTTLTFEEVASGWSTPLVLTSAQAVPVTPGHDRDLVRDPVRDLVLDLVLDPDPDPDPTIVAAKTTATATTAATITRTWVMTLQLPRRRQRVREADDNASGDKGAEPSEENENGDDAKDQDTAN